MLGFEDKKEDRGRKVLGRRNEECEASSNSLIVS